MAKYGNTIYKQLQQCDICEATISIEDECIHNLLNHLSPKCVLKPVKQSFRIEEIKEGIILLDTNTKVSVSDSCNNSRVINTPTIIEADNCTIKIKNFTFNNHKQLSNQDEYLIPIYGKRLTQLNYTEEESEITHIKLQNLNSIHEIKLDLHRSKRTTVIGGGTLLTLIILCFFTIRSISRKAKAKKGTISKIEDPPRTTEEQSTGMQNRTSGRMPTIILQDESPEDGRQSERGGVTPRPVTLAMPRVTTQRNPAKALGNE